MPDCPDDTELAGFLNESLPTERLGHVSGHVDGCAHCQARLDRLTEQTSGAVARYKELSSGILPDSKSSGGAEENTLVLGGKPIGPPTAFLGLPRVPGFEVVAEIGRGGMGVVYKARHRRLNRLVALKMILAGTAADARVVQRFLFEAEVLARIQHPQVVQVFEVDTYQGPNGVPIPYLAMELLEGGSLSRKLRDNATAPAATRWPSQRVAVELIEGIARAVHAAHLQGIIHRDLKPGNVLFAAEVKKVETQKSVSGRHDVTTLLTDTGKPKVMDFGLAKFTREAGADLTQSGQLIGTPQYMAPEQAAGSKEIGPAADVYALGAILFECLAGRPPFQGGDPVSVLLKVVNELPPDVRTLQPSVTRDLAAVTMKCLEKDPSRRYASAEALADDLGRFLHNQPTRARPVRNIERLWLWAKRNPAVSGLITALAVVLLAALGIVAALWVRAEQNARDESDAKQRSERSEKRAREEAQNASNALREAERQKARLEFDRAAASCDEGRVRDGLVQFLRAAEIAEQNDEPTIARAARINLAAWPRDLPPAARAIPHKDQPRHVAFTPDGNRFVSATRKGELFLWDSASGEKKLTYKPAKRLFGSTRTYWTVAISPDGKTVAAGGDDHDITLWNIDSEEPTVSFAAVGGGSLIPALNNEHVWSLGFSSNTVLWSNDGRHGLKRWDLTAKPTPKAIALSPMTLYDGDEVQIIAVSTDGKRVYSGDRKSMVREWDTEKLTEGRKWLCGDNWITDLAVSDDRTRLAATGPGGMVWTIDLTTGKFGPEIPLAGAYGNGVAFAPKRPYLIASDGDGNVRFWHRETGQPIGIPMRFHGEVLRPRFKPDSDEFAVPAGRAVYLCGLPDPPGDLLSVGHGFRVRGLAFSPTGERLAVVDEKFFELFDLPNHKPIQTVSGWKEGPLTLCFDPDPARPFVYRGVRGLALGGGVERVAVPGGTKFKSAVAFRLGRVYRIDAARTGGLFAMGEGVVARFDPMTFTQGPTKEPTNDIPSGVTLNTMAVRPDGGEVLVSFANRVIFLKPDTLEVIREWKTGDELLDARYTPDGTKVLIARRDNVAELLNATDGKPTSARPMPHARAVTSVAISPDGALFLTGSRDGTARFWDAATGLPLGSPLRHAGPVTHVAFAPTGDHVATATGTGNVMIWDLPPTPAKGTIEELRAKFSR